jgi:SAM-dependent methyltransferase
MMTLLTAPDLPEDRRQQREWLLGLAGPPTGVFVDLGCGRGDDLCLLAAQHPAADVRLIGADALAKALTIATARAAADPRISFRHARLDTRLPFEDGTVDTVYSHNLLECLADPSAFASEVARILRPGGQVVIGHWDWDSQEFDGTDKALVRRLVHAYADWQQAWMDHADGWMGRRLWGVFNATGLFDGGAQARVLTNTEYTAPWFGYENAQTFRSLIKRGLAEAEDCDRFEREQSALHAQGRYFYSITGYAYVGRRRAA